MPFQKGILVHFSQESCRNTCYDVGFMHQFFGKTLCIHVNLYSIFCYSTMLSIRILRRIECYFLFLQFFFFIFSLFALYFCVEQCSNIPYLILLLQEVHNQKINLVISCFSRQRTYHPINIATKGPSRRAFLFSGQLY